MTAPSRAPADGLPPHLAVVLSLCWGGDGLMVVQGVLGPGGGPGSGCCGQSGGAGDVVPDGEADGHLEVVFVCGHQVASGAEVG